MKKTPLNPKDWRKAHGYSMASVARLLGIDGKNPSRTWHRYENGEREPPLALVCKIEEMSNGLVPPSSWVRVREAYFARQREVSV